MGSDTLTGVMILSWKSLYETSTGVAVVVEASTGPEGCRRLRLPGFL
jgi:hypothetical protein